MLLEAGEDDNSQDGYCGNALAAARHGGHIEIARMLLAAGAWK